jgi:hypothetical protein
LPCHHLAFRDFPLAAMLKGLPRCCRFTVRRTLLRRTPLRLPRSRSATLARTAWVRCTAPRLLRIRRPQACTAMQPTLAATRLGRRQVLAQVQLEVPFSASKRLAHRKGSGQTGSMHGPMDPATFWTGSGRTSWCHLKPAAVHLVQLREDSEALWLRRQQSLSVVPITALVIPCRQEPMGGRSIRGSGQSTDTRARPVPSLRPGE